MLYNSQVSGNCYKVRLLLAHLGVDYERRELDVVDRSNRDELLGDLNPALRVPTLVLDDGRPLAESNAILCYFADGTQYLPEDRYDRALVVTPERVVQLA
jgi:glutathione S-transferase